MSESVADGESRETNSPLAAALDKGIFYDGFYEDGRIRVILGPGALDALCEILDRRKRHLPVPQDAMDELRYWQQYVCTAHERRHSREVCTTFVDAAHQRCPEHLAIGRLHPGAQDVLETLSPRARRFFEWLLERQPRYFDYGRTRVRQLVQQTGLSASTLNRALRELTDAHLAWRKGHGERFVIHPAIAFFDGYGRHREALEDLRLDRRTAFAHLEPSAQAQVQAA